MQGVTFWAFFLDIRAQNTSKLYLPTFPESNKWDFHLHITLIPKNVRTDEFQTLQKMSEARVELLKMFWWFQNIAAEVISDDCHSLETCSVIYWTTYFALNQIYLLLVQELVVWICELGVRNWAVLGMKLMISVDRCASPYEFLVARNKWELVSIHNLKQVMPIPFSKKDLKEVNTNYIGCFGYFLVLCNASKIPFDG